MSLGETPAFLITSSNRSLLTSFRYFCPFAFSTSFLRFTIKSSIFIFSISSRSPSAPVLNVKKTFMSYSKILKYSSSERTDPGFKLLTNVESASAISSTFLLSAATLSAILTILCFLESSSSCSMSSFCSAFPPFASLSFVSVSLFISDSSVSASFLRLIFLSSIFPWKFSRAFFFLSSSIPVTKYDA
ncbi:MAG: hypothetical protein ACD_37C00588G0002 [uncultured bacterium]|nr:MAG: hypothetical protein ACD_37C00588G0002 [uncultured bacterium]